MVDDPKGGKSRKFKDDLDKVLSKANPNPRRIGCLSREALEALASRKTPLGDPAYEHLLQCSECYREFRRFQPAGDDQES